jgi:hypothetical protein
MIVLVLTGNRRLREYVVRRSASAGAAAVPAPVARLLGNAALRVYLLDQPDAYPNGCRRWPGTSPRTVGWASGALKAGPFPEQLRSAIVQLIQSSLARVDRSDVRRDRWLCLPDRLGLGVQLVALAGA